MKFLLDPGHSGVEFGHYFTKGKRSPEVPPGIYEGDFNRQICRIIQEWFNHPVSGVDGAILCPGPINVPLHSRVKFANQVYSDIDDCAYISIHANAMGNSWNNAHGFTVFHARNASKKSKLLAEYIETHLSISGSGIKSRGIKTPRSIGKYFYVLSKTRCPAVLIECGFMTNKEEVENLKSIVTQYHIAIAIFNALKLYQKDVE